MGVILVPSFTLCPREKKNKNSPEEHSSPNDISLRTKALTDLAHPLRDRSFEALSCEVNCQAGPWPLRREAHITLCLRVKKKKNPGRRPEDICFEKNVSSAL
jgi:hypothetical protein